MIAPARAALNADTHRTGLAEAIRQSVAMLKCIFAPEDWICFHALGKYGGKKWATLADDEVEAVIEWVWQLNTRTSHRCQPFFGANARRGNGQDRAEGTAYAWSYFADWEGITPERAIELVLAAGLPLPTVLMTSGRGVHAYWRLHDPEHDAGEWTHRQKWIAAAVQSDPAVSDFQRKMRLPGGFANVKEKYAPNFPVSWLVFAEPSRRYSWRDLQPRHIPEPERRPEPTAAQLAEVARLPPGSMSQLTRRFIEEGFTLPQGRHCTAFTAACDLSARGWKVEDATAVVVKAMRRWLNRGPMPLTNADIKDTPRIVQQAYSQPRTPIIDGPGAVPLRIEHHADDATEFVSLDEYRERIAAAVSKAVRTAGVHLNTAGTGCGKTFATAKKTATFSASVTSAPTHALCEERARELRSFGADAVAYPPLDAMTCENFAVASRVQAAGLSPSRVLCNSCEFRTACEVRGYLAVVKAADKAPHKVVTHERLARSAKTLCKHAECIVLEEEPTAAVRPSLDSRAKDMAAVAGFAKVMAKGLREDEANVEIDLADMGFAGDPEHELPTGGPGFAEFAAWAPSADSVLAEPVKESVRDVVHGPRHRTRALMAKRQHKAAFFRHVADVAAYLRAETREAMRKGDGVYVIGMPAAVKPPRNTDGIVWPYLKAADEPPAPEALRLAVAAASGGLHSLVVQVDANTRYAKSHPGAKPLLRARIVGLWQTAVPYDSVPVIINDGTNDAATVQAIIGREVNDITPAGRVPLQHACVQYAVDVTQGTKTQTVANIVCGIARAHPDKPRIGLILHMKHRDKLFPEIDDRNGKRRRKRTVVFPDAIRDRIVWVTHFNSGLDRGSNDMFGKVDLAVVVGTYRPPAHRVRRRLIESGRIAEAHAGDRWGVIERHARQPNGEPVVYHGLGYASEAWRQAAESLTRATARQAVGRPRANTPEGKPVVAVTTEATGLPVLPAAALPRSRTEVERVVEAVGAADPTCATSATNTISGCGTSCSLVCDCSVLGATIALIHEHVPKWSRRSLMRWLTAAVEAGAVIRTGKTTATRYRLPRSPEPPRRSPAASAVAPAPKPGSCPACGSCEHEDTVSRDGQVGRRVCGECGEFIAYTIWNGEPLTTTPPAPAVSARVLDLALTLSE